MDAAPVALMAFAPEEERLGGLAWRGGLHLRSGDPRFGGVSGLAVDADGAAFAAITDAGRWITGALVWEGGRLAAVAALEVAPLRDAAGAPLVGKTDGDAEALARAPDGSYVVAFEHRHRLLAYSRPGGPGVPVFPELDLAGLPPNGGVEALAFMPGGALLALAEGAAGDGRQFRGAGGVSRDGRGDGAAHRLRRQFQPRPTHAAARLRAGRIVTAEKAA